MFTPTGNPDVDRLGTAIDVLQTETTEAALAQTAIAGRISKLLDKIAAAPDAAAVATLAQKAQDEVAKFKLVSDALTDMGVDVDNPAPTPLPTPEPEPIPLPTPDPTPEP